jgi:methionine sulfoxide reductase heme-binding subunit
MRLSYPPFIYAASASIAAILLGLSFGQGALEQALYMVRGTARIGIPLVLIIYTASAMHTLWPNDWTNSVYKNRRSWGLSFAFTHTVHLFAIINYLNQPGMVDPGPLGIIGFSFIYLMAFSSNTNSIKRLGKWWKRIHTVGIHVIWIYYLVAYVQMVLEPELRHIGLVVVPLILAALAIRIAAWSKGRKRVVGSAS